jgi:D-mannonate dehydratase
MKKETIIPIAIILLVFCYLMYQKGCNNELSKRPNYPSINVDSLIKVNKIDDSIYWANKIKIAESKPKVQNMSKAEIKTYYNNLVRSRTDIIYIHDTTINTTAFDSCEQLAIMYSIDYEICAEQLMDCEAQMDKKNNIINVLSTSLKLTQSDIKALELEVAALTKQKRNLKRLTAFFIGLSAALVLK